MSKIAAEVVTRGASKKDKRCQFIKYESGHKDRTQSLQNETIKIKLPVLVNDSKVQRGTGRKS